MLVGNSYVQWGRGHTRTSDQAATQAHEQASEATGQADIDVPEPCVCSVETPTVQPLHTTNIKHLRA